LTTRRSGSLVLEDQATIVTVDPRQPHEGHVLVIPRRHVPTLFDLDEAVGTAIMKTTVRVAKAIRATFAPEGLSLWQSNGPAAFQEIAHLHLHLIPRWKDDGLLRIYPRRIERVDDSVCDDMAARIRAKLL
jgi:histidine triad (HIT) family protein